jgi:hypothetical protein
MCNVYTQSFASQTTEFRNPSIPLVTGYDTYSKDCVPIALGVLRMVKLFGWEHKMSATIKEKRDEELVWIWKDRVR